MPTRESDALSAAMAATDQELFASALGDDPAVHDETGDRSLEQQDDGLEGKVEDEGKEEAEAVAADEDGEAKEDEGETAEKGPKKDPATGKFVKADAEEKAEEKPEGEEPVKDEQIGRVPSARLRQATEKTKAAEAERDALKAAREEDKRERDALKAQMELLSRQFAQRQQPETKPEVKAADAEPDMFAQPEEWRAWNRRENAREIAAVREENTKALVNMNLAMAHEIHGDKFLAAYNHLAEAVKTDPEARIASLKAWQSGNAAAEIMKWHRQQEVLREFGADPAATVQKKIDEALEAKLADPEFRKSQFAKWTEEAGGKGGAAPRHVTRIPKSLNGASGSAQLSDPTFEDASEQSFFDRSLAS